MQSVQFDSESEREILRPKKEFFTQTTWPLAKIEIREFGISEAMSVRPRTVR